MSKKEVVIYCMACSTVDVKDLPWEAMTYFNHAFWKVDKQNNSFCVVPCYPDDDFGLHESRKNNFKAFEEIHKKYPNVNIMLSVGGAGLCRYYSEMSLTRESRKSFIDSCISTLHKFDFLAGIDLDWEFPGVTYNDNPDNPGCLKVGNDKKNYPLLLKEMRKAFDKEFGKGIKKLTVCSPASGNYLAKQGIPRFHKYVDLINMMTYDLDGCSKKAGHHTALYRRFPKQCVDTGSKILQKKGVPKSKIVVGSPLYSHGLVLQNPNTSKIIGAKGSQAKFNGIMMYHDIAEFERQSVPENVPGWHIGYDSGANGAYIWNNDKSSEYYGYFMTYESRVSLKRKIEYIKENDLGGIIVWQADGDIYDGFPMITYMAEHLWGRN